MEFALLYIGAGPTLGPRVSIDRVDGPATVRLAGIPFLGGLITHARTRTLTHAFERTCARTLF